MKKIEGSIETLIQLGIMDFFAQFGVLPNVYLNEAGVQLSGGQKKIIGLARAIVAGKKIIMFDEPVNELDAETGLFFWKIVEEYFTDHLVIVVSHNQKLPYKFDFQLHLQDINKTEKSNDK